MADEEIPAARAIVTRAEAKALGLERYWTGQPCKHGHLSERYVKNFACCECNLKTCRDRYRANRDAELAISKAWYARHREAVLVAKKAEREADPEAHRAKRRAYYAANPKPHLTRVAVWREGKRDALRQYAKAYGAAHLQEALARNRTRRARVMASGGKHTAADVRAIFGLQKGRCAHCRTGIKSGWHVDHILPLALGGSNDRRNLQLLCAPCNLRKRAKHPLDHARELGRLL